MEEQENYDTTVSGDGITLEKEPKEEKARLLGDRIAIRLFRLTHIGDPKIIIDDSLKEYDRMPAGQVQYVGDGVIGDTIVPMPFAKNNIVVLDRIIKEPNFRNGRIFYDPITAEQYLIVRRSEIVMVYSGSNDFKQDQEYYNNFGKNKNKIN